MSQYVLNITQNNHTKTTHLASNQQTLRVAAASGARYQILNAQGILVMQPKMKEMGADLWVFLDGQSDTVPDIIIEGYGYFSPIVNDMTLMQMDATLALTNTPSAMHLTPVNTASVPDSTALLASEVSSAPAGNTAAVAETVSGSTASTVAAETTGAAASSTASSGTLKRVVGGALILALMGGGGAAIAAATRDDDEDNNSNTNTPTTPTTPTNPDAPVIQLNAVAGDNVINEHEATATFAISGSVSGAREGDVVRVLVDDQVIATGSVVADSFSLDVSGSTLAHATNQNLTVEVIATNEQGGQTTGSVVANYEFIELNAPTITLNQITGDNVINQTEAATNISLSGSVSGAKTGDQITLTLGNSPLATATVLANGTFSVDVSGSTLANASTKTVTAQITTSDAYGNSETASAAQSYTVPTLTAPTITLNQITGDNVINQTEATANITLSGSVSGAKTGDQITLTLGNSPLATATVLANGTFSVDVSGSTLANASTKTVTAQITTSDAYGNSETASAAQSYTVPTLTAPTITLNQITDDNAINETEATGTITLSGSVSGAKTGDQITLTLGNSSLATTTVLANGTFSVDVSGSTLANASTKTVSAEVIATDVYGNSATASTSQNYTVPTLATPEITLNALTGDNILNAAEVAATVTISGSLKQVSDGTRIEIKLGNSTLTTTTASNGTFSVDVAGSALSAATEQTMTARVVTRDDYGNEKVAENSLTYTVQTTAVTPTVTIDAIATDDMINAAEAAQNLTISGSVVGANTGDRVELVLDNNVVATTTVLNGGTFWQYVSGNVLANATTTQLIARVIGNDAAGNPFVGTGERDYDAKVSLTTPVLSIHAITDDNVISGTEASGDISISGSVQYAQDGETVEIIIDNQPIARANVSSGSFSVNVSGSLLANATNKTVTAQLTTSDDVGNSATGSTSHQYTYQPYAATPEVSLNSITYDNVINATEATENITISGKTSLADGKTVELLLDHVTVATATVAGGRFVTTIAGADFVNAQNQTLIAKVVNSDAAGNTATATAERDFEIHNTLPTASIMLNPITTDGIINGTEATQSPFVMTGTTTGTRLGDTIELLLDGKPIASTISQGDGKEFGLSLNDGSALVNANIQELTVRVVATDAYGNSSIASNTQTYQVELSTDQPIISLNYLTDDNIINLSESTLPVTISGKVQNVQDSDEIQLLLDDRVFTTITSSNGVFSVDVSGSLLANADSTRLTARVSTTSAAGNVADGETHHDYEVDITAPQPTIQLEAISDGTLNAAESAVSLLLKGTVDGARVGDTVSLSLNGASLGETKVLDGYVFELPVSGSLLATAQGTQTVSATIIATDAAGNSGTASATQTVWVDTVAPSDAQASLNPITGDDVLNTTGDIAQNITLSGSTDSAFSGNTVRFTIGAQTFSTSVTANGTFSVEVAGQVLAANQSVAYELDAVDAAGNTATVSFTHDYQVVSLPKPSVSGLLLAGDNRLNENEATGTISLSGQVSGAREGDKVSILLNQQELATTTVSSTGQFVVPSLSGERLANAEQTKLIITVEATDEAGNRTTGSGEVNYTLSTLSAPVLSDLVVADDDVLNSTEATSNVILSGKVSGAREGDTVNIVLDGVPLATGQVSNNAFSITLDGAALAAASTKELGVTVIATDDAGNQKSGGVDITYDVVSLAAPVVTIASIANDDKLSELETTETVMVSGSVSGAKMGDTVTVLLNGTEIGKGQVSDNFQFNIEVSGQTLAAADQKEITVSVLATDEYGNETAGTASKSYELASLDTPEVLITAIAGTDFVLSATEATGTVSVQGTVSPAYDGNTVRVLLGDVQIGTGTVSQNAFAVDVDSTTLVQAANKQITVEVLVNDGLGNEELARSVHVYSLDTLAEPRITFNPIAQDDVIDANEAAAEITISGSVVGAREGDTVRVMVGDATPITTTVAAGGTFSVNVAGQLLVQASSKTVTVEVLATDILGNETVGSQSANYTFASLSAPVVTLNAIADDNKLNMQEAATDVVISGSVTGAKQGDTVQIHIDNNIQTTTVTAEGTFSVTISGSVLANAAVKTVTAEVSTSDILGNQNTGSQSQNYEVVTLATPTFSDVVIAEDNVLNMTEAAGTITISGKINGAQDGDVITLLLDGQPLTEKATVASNAFSVTLSGSLLAGATTPKLTLEVNTSDDAGNTAKGTIDATYTLKDLAVPTITLNAIADNNVVDLEEAARADIAISGHVTGAREGDTVRVMVGDAAPVTTLVTANGTFSVNVSGSQLATANIKTVTAEVVATDEFGNQQTGTAEQIYQVSTLNVPTITMQDVANDTILDSQEVLTDVVISGSVAARDGDVVRIKIDGEVRATTQVQSGQFTTTLAGSILRDATTQSVDVEVVVTDDTGSSVLATESAAYTLDTLPTPTVSITSIAGDNQIDATEVSGNVAVIGSITNIDKANAGATVRLLQGNTELATATVSSDGAYRFDVSGSLLKDATDKTLTVEVSVQDNLGHVATGTQSATYSIAALAQPEVSITSIAGEDLVLNKAESESMVVISGSVVGAREGDTVRVLLDNTPITNATGTVSATGTYRIELSGSVLAKDASATSGEITVEVTATDTLGNTAIGSQTAEYQIQTQITTPTITLDPISGDGYLNAQELAQNTNLSGSVGNVIDANATVTLKLGELELANNVKVVNGRFSIDVNTYELRNATDQTITAIVNVKDSAGNTTSATNTATYQVIDQINPPTVELDDIAGDNYVNAAEASAAEIEITGRVQTNPVSAGIATTEKVTLTIGNYTATVDVTNGHFAHKVSGEILKAASSVKAVATTTDVAGNSASSVETIKNYTVNLVINEPIIQVNAITGDDIINANEVGLDNVNIMGSATHTQNGDVVTITIGDKTYNTTITNQSFMITTTGAELAAAQAVKVSVLAHDVSGNSVLAEHSHSYQVVTSAEQPALMVNRPIAGDNIINQIEATQTITITGRAENALYGSWVETTLNGKTIYGYVNNDDKTYSINVSGAELAAHASKELILTVVNKDLAGNTATANVTVNYDVDLVADTPIITMNPITLDNIINYTEARETNIAVSGSLTNVRESDDVKIVVGGNTYTGKVVNSGFSINVPASVLAKYTSVDVTVIGSDVAGNTATAMLTHDYKVDTTAPVSSIVINPITGDGVINLAESGQDAIAITGSTTGARINDQVVLTIGSKTFSGSVLENGTFSINVAGQDLLNQTQVYATLTATDEAGNEGLSNTSRNYQVNTTLAKPIISIQNITNNGDNIINLQESTSDIVITGYATNTREGDAVVLRLGATDYPATITGNNGKFSVTISGEELAKYREFTVTVNNTDAAGNHEQNSYIHTYQVITDITQPNVSLDNIATDGVINQTESYSTLTLTGKADNAVGGKVTLNIGSSTYSATVGAEGTFAFNISGSTLVNHAGDLKEGTVTVNLVVTDTAGNTATASNSQTYQVITEMPNPEITIGSVSEDNIISASEAAAGQTVTITGTVTNAKDGDKVIVSTGASYTEHVGVIKGNTYAIEVAGSELAENSRYMVRVETSDHVGNTASQSATGSYQVDISAGTPTITIDEKLFKRSQLDDLVTFTGSVSYNNDIDEKNVQVTITLNGQNHTATVSGNRWTLNVAGNELGAKWGANEIKATISVTDHVGNQATGTGTGQYQAELAELKFNPITGDDIITAKETSATNLTVTGYIIGDYQTNDQVSVILHNVTHTASVNANGTFSMDLPTANMLINGDTTKVYSSRFLDGYFSTTDNGTTHQVNTEHTYYVKTLTNIRMELDNISEDNVIDKTDIANRVVNITGRLYSLSDPEHDLKKVYNVTTEINGTPYSGKTNGLTGEFIISVSASDLANNPPTGNYGQVIKVSLTTTEDNFGNPIKSEDQISYQTNLNSASAYIAPRVVLENNDDEITALLADESNDSISGSLNESDAEAVYRTISTNSVPNHDDNQNPDYYLNTTVDSSPYAPVETATADDSDYTYPIAASTNPYTYAPISETSEYEVVDDQSQTTAESKEIAVSEPITEGESEWTLAETHDLNENVLAEKANALSTDDGMDYQAVEQATPYLMSNTEVSNDSQITTDYNHVSGLIHNDEWEATGYHII